MPSVPMKGEIYVDVETLSGLDAIAVQAELKPTPITYLCEMKQNRADSASIEKKDKKKRSPLPLKAPQILAFRSPYSGLFRTLLV